MVGEVRQISAASSTLLSHHYHRFLEYHRNDVIDPCRVRYSRSLEEGSFRGRPADFLTCLLFGMVSLLVRGALMILRWGVGACHP